MWFQCLLRQPYYRPREEMISRTSISQRRAAALKILIEECLDEDYLLIDFWIDSQCREILNLPERGKGTLPYAPWVIKDKKPQ